MNKTAREIAESIIFGPPDDVFTLEHVRDLVEAALIGYAKVEREENVILRGQVESLKLELHRWMSRYFSERKIGCK